MRTFGTPVDSRRIGGFALSLTRYAAGSALPWHDHREAYLTFVVDGEYREMLRGTTRDCTASSVVYHPAGEQHADRFGARAASCLDVRFDSTWLDSVGERGCVIARPAMLQPVGVGSRILREFRHPDALSGMVVEGLLLELFAEEERRGTPPAWLCRVRDILESQSEHLSLREIASEAGVHPTHLTRAFRAAYGCTIGEFARARRVERAKERLRGRESLSRIATDLGFSDQSHFTRTFRRLTGHTPAAFRRALIAF